MLAGTCPPTVTSGSGVTTKKSDDKAPNFDEHDERSKIADAENARI